MDLVIIQGLLFWSSTGARAAPAGLDPIDNMCMRFLHQSIIKNGILYVYGGLETFAPSVNGTVVWTNITLGYNEDLILVDMAQPWDWKSNISETAVNISTNLKPTTGTSPPDVNHGVLFQGAPSDSNIYLYGGTISYWNTSFPGWQGPSSQQYVLWSYDVNTKTWNQYDISDASPWRPSSGLSAEAPDQGLAFYLNGELDSGSSFTTEDLGDNIRVFIEGMIVINTTAQTAVNLSTADVTGAQPRTRGGMSYIPQYGEHGILILIGGTFKQSDVLNDEYLSNFVSMSQVDVFDIDAYYRHNESYSGWYALNVTGDIPNPRAEFCVVMISAPDNTSHNIYLYGGIGENNVTFDDIYVLSIPSFEWTQVYGPGQSPRYRHTCHIVGSTMITVGGQTPDADCDWESEGVGVLDMSSMIWGSVYTPTASEYSLPSLVARNLAKINGSGPATQPIGGFGNSQLPQLFGVAVESNATVPSQRQTPLRNAHSNGLNHVGAIVGGVIGGVIGLAALLLGSLCLWKRKKQSKIQNQMQEDNKSDHVGELGDTQAYEVEQPVPELGEGQKHEIEANEVRLEMEADGNSPQEMQA